MVYFPADLLVSRDYFSILGWEFATYSFPADIDDILRKFGFVDDPLNIIALSLSAKFAKEFAFVFPKIESGFAVFPKKLPAAVDISFVLFVAEGVKAWSVLRQFGIALDLRKKNFLAGDGIGSGAMCANEFFLTVKLISRREIAGFFAMKNGESVQNGGVIVGKCDAAAPELFD